MKKILILSVLVLLASCQEKDSLGGDGRNPLEDCVVSSDVRPGGEVVIQWNGFGSSPVLLLSGAGGREYPVSADVVTASGLIFRIPSDVPPGVYSVFMNAGDRILLGSLEVLPPDMPVTGISFPRAVEPGKDFIVRGVGFSENVVLKLAGSGEARVLEYEKVSSGAKVKMPSDMALDVYSLYLSDGVDEWLLSDSFTVTVRKKLLSVSRQAPLQDEVVYRSGYEVEYEGDEVKAIVFTASQLENGVVLSEEVHDRYVLGSDGVFRAEGGQSSSLNLNFGYERDGEGRILAADVLRFSRNNPDGAMRSFGWNYDSEGRPLNVTFVLDGVTRSLQVYFYENDNLVETMFSVFVYDDNSLRNNPFAADVAMGYEVMSILDEPFLFAPFLMGEHPFVSANLPSAIMEPSGLMGSLVRKDVAYQFDADGYVVRMSWNAGSDCLDFEYQ